MPRGPRPMHPTVRARVNRTTTRGELPVLEPAERAKIEVPELPSDRMWDPHTHEFWEAAWRSPMRLEWDAADLHKLTMAVYVLDEFWAVTRDDDMKRFDKAMAVNKLAKTVVDLTARMGLDPFARRSLQWLLVKTEKDEADRDNAKERTAASRAQRAAAKPASARRARGLKGLE